MRAALLSVLVGSSIVASSSLARAEDAAPDVKSGTTAAELSVGATLAGFGLAAASSHSHNETLAYASLALIVIGPSAGHIYAGENGHAAIGSVVRFGGLTILAIGALEGVLEGFGDSSNTRNNSQSSDHSSATTMIWLGGAAYVGATVYDLIDASSAADRANAKHQRNLMLVPAPINAPSGVAPGFALTGRF